MALLESAVLLDKVKIITTNDDGAGHLLLTNDTGQNATTEQEFNIEVFSNFNQELKTYMMNKLIQG